MTLTLTPDLTFDALNVSKLMALGMVAGFALSELYLHKKNFCNIIKSPHFILAIFFLMGLSVPLFFSNSPVQQQLYGTSGRNLGFLHYLFLTTILLGVSLIRTANRVHLFLLTLSLTGIFEAAYSLLQLSGLDPISWKNPDRWTFGTFGNPNFLSSFLALSTLSSIYFAIKYKGLTLRVYFVLSSIFQFVIILWSNSSQGILLVGLGVYLIAQFYAFDKSRILGFALLVCGIFVILISLLGILQKGPLVKFLYQESVTFRGDYWRAGISMFKNNWVNGVGLDSFGDHYRQYRDVTAANRRGLDVVSNSAHNLLIDFAATGGALLLISYVGLQIIVLTLIIARLRNRNVQNFEYRILIILWTLFNIQTFISINVPSIAIWGWLISGLILSASKEGHAEQKSKRIATRKKNKEYLVSLFILTLIYLALVVPAFYREVSLKKAMKLNNIGQIYASAIMFPKDALLMSNIAIAFKKANLEMEAHELFWQATKVNPNRIEPWLYIYQSPLSNEMEKKLSKNMLLKLDPNLVLE